MSAGTEARVTKSQLAFLRRHREHPARRYNGRSLAMVERLAAAGYLTYDFELVHAGREGRYTMRVVVTMTESGEQL